MCVLYVLLIHCKAHIETHDRPVNLAASELVAEARTHASATNQHHIPQQHEAGYPKASAVKETDLHILVAHPYEPQMQEPLEQASAVEEAKVIDMHVAITHPYEPRMRGPVLRGPILQDRVSAMLCVISTSHISSTLSLH